MLLLSVDKYPLKEVIASSGLSVCMSQQKISLKKTKGFGLFICC